MIFGLVSARVLFEGLGNSAYGTVETAVAAVLEETLALSASGTFGCFRDCCYCGEEDEGLGEELHDGGVDLVGFWNGYKSVDGG